MVVCGMTTMQPEYIITEGVIQNIGEYLKGPYDTNGVLNMLRSRPHTPAPEPSVDCFWKCEHGKRLQEEASRAATLAFIERLQERRNYLNSLMKDDEVNDALVDEYDSLIESLRQQAGE
jgi:hypothetical protein